jgi:hypothetical protein
LFFAILDGVVAEIKAGNRDQGIGNRRPGTRE